MSLELDVAPSRLSTIKDDVFASVVVLLVALPLSMGLALVAGFPFENAAAVGLISGVIGGIVVGMLSGCPLQVSGAANGAAVMAAVFIKDLGFEVFGLIVIMSGVIQIAAGALRFGPVFRAVAPALISGHARRNWLADFRLAISCDGRRYAARDGTGVWRRHQSLVAAACRLEGRDDGGAPIRRPDRTAHGHRHSLVAPLGAEMAVLSPGPAHRRRPGDGGRGVLCPRHQICPGAGRSFGCGEFADNSHPWQDRRRRAVGGGVVARVRFERGIASDGDRRRRDAAPHAANPLQQGAGGAGRRQFPLRHSWRAADIGRHRAQFGQCHGGRTHETSRPCCTACGFCCSSPSRPTCSASSPWRASRQCWSTRGSI